MYEHITYEEIVRRILARAPDTMDKREGSILYDAVAPMAVEIQNLYLELDTILSQGFIDTAEGEYLEMRCAERGIFPAEATHAVMQGEFNMDIPIGSRYSLGDYNYTAKERVSQGVYRLECETVGSEPNAVIGALTPIDYIDGLISAAITKNLIPGEDREEQEHLRARYYDSLDAQAFGGNIADYREKTAALPGVGDCKVYPVWNGGGTVKVVIIDSNFAKPSDALLSEVQAKIDPPQKQGQGYGLAPIGHVVTVAGVSEAPVNIQSTITYQGELGFADLKAAIEEAVDGYFLELAGTWAQEEKLIVRISQIEMRLLDLPGILDISGTKLNGTESNYIVPQDSIPVRGTIDG